MSFREEFFVRSASELLKVTIFSVATLVTLNSLISCGPSGSTRPAKKYDQLRKSSIPERPVQPRNQVYVGTDTYSIKPETNLEFVTGRKTEVKIKALLQIPGAQYDLIANDLPEGATLTQDPSNPLFWILNWQPNTDVIPRGQKQISGEIHFALQINSLPDVQSETFLKKMTTQATVVYTVSIAQDRPIITAINDLSEEIKEGASVNFTVVVKDAVSETSNPPKLDIFYTGQESSSEGLRFNGSMFVTQKGAPVKNEADGTWTFLMSFSTAVVNVPEFSTEGLRNKNTVLPISFYLKAISANETVSSDNKIDRVIRYDKAILKPEFSTEKEGTFEVFQGGKLNFSFSVILANGRGALTTQFNDAEINAWPGVHNFACDDVKTNSKGEQDDNTIKKSCRIVWDLPCDIDTKKYDVSLIASAYANANDKDPKQQQVLKRTIQVRKAEVCQPPKPAKPPKAAVAATTKTLKNKKPGEKKK